MSAIRDYEQTLSLAMLGALKRLGAEIHGLAER